MTKLEVQVRDVSDESKSAAETTISNPCHVRCEAVALWYFVASCGWLIWRLPCARLHVTSRVAFASRLKTLKNCGEVRAGG